MKFYLHSPNDSSSLLYLSVSFNYLRLRLSVGFSVNSRFWDTKNQRVNHNQPGYIIINNELARIKYEISDFLTQLKISKSNIEKIEFENKIKSIIKPNSYLIEKQNDFFSKYLQWIENRKSSNRYSLKTINNYFLVYYRFKSFIESKQIPITFEKINDTLLDDFLAYMINNYNYVNNTANINLKKLKAFLHDIENEVGVKYNFKPIKESKNYETPSVTLDEDELQKIETLELDNHRQLIRDIFIIQIHTLLRISDLNQIKKTQFDIEKGILTVNQYKTGGQVIIPIIEKVRKILQIWNYQVPQINKQTYNKYLKEICKIAELTQEYEIVRYSGNQRIVEVKPKYELISSHTARRTGITLLIKKGVPMSMIMKISGHKNIETLMKYVRLTQEEAIDSVRKAWEEM